MIREAFQEVNRFIAVSYFMQHIICKNLNMASKKIDVIYPPLPNFPYIPRENSPSKITFTYIGGLEVHKGIKNLLRAFHIATSKNKEIELLVCGSGTMERWIKNYIHNANLEKYIKVIGKVNFMKLYEIYQKTDIVIVPSLWPEPFGRVAMEALCAGRPVIVNPVGGLREQVIDGFNGFYVNCYNIHELAKGILDISETPRQILFQMGFKAREDVLKRFDSEIRAQKLLKVYELVV
jgi:glycosyltransferase involved in cell wall biosynthesis